MSNVNTSSILNQSVADLAKAAALVHQIHWYLRGPGFLNLHPTMDKFLDDLYNLQDEFAERLITIGGSPVSTLKEFDETSKINLEPATWNKTISQRLEELKEAYKYLAQHFKEGIAVADENDDEVTADLYTGALGDIEKTIWMIEAELGE
ncbi:MAG: DNA starvation/stationary phase protection protein [Lactococcus sp.]